MPVGGVLKLGHSLRSEWPEGPQHSFAAFPLKVADRKVPWSRSDLWNSNIRFDLQLVYQPVQRGGQPALGLTRPLQARM